MRCLRAVGAVLLRLPRPLGGVLALSWAALIYYVSSQPAPSLGEGIPFAGLLENFGHAVEYGVLAVFLALVAPRREGWVDLGARASAAILAVILVYAASDEWHQSLVPNRDGTPFDVITDVAGAAATLACIAGLARRRGAGRILAVRFTLGLVACLAAAALAASEP